MSYPPSFEADRDDDGLTTLVGAREALFALGLAALAGAFVYDSRQPSVEPLVAGFDPLPIDWLFGVSLVFLSAYGVWPLAAAPDRAREVWRRLRERPVALFALGWIVAVALLGTVGRALVGTPGPQFSNSTQPPVFGTVSMAHTFECVGRVADGVCHGTWQHPFGTTRSGRDVFAFVLAAMGISVQIAVITSALVVPLGTVAGLVTGYTDGRLASAIDWYVDFEQTIPALVVYILLVGVFGRGLVLFVLVYGLFDWSGVADLVRTNVETVVQSDYVRYSEVSGGDDAFVLSEHVLPNVGHTVATAATNRIPLLILIEAALSYLDLSEPEAFSWGRIITGELASVTTLWWVTTLPVICLAATVLAFNTLGDAFQEVLDPRA